VVWAKIAQCKRDLVERQLGSAFPRGLIARLRAVNHARWIPAPERATLRDAGLRETCASLRGGLNSALLIHSLLENLKWPLA
jgi:hypothetical protein